MARYIDASQAAEIVSNALKIDIYELVDVFADIPTAVVRCKDCQNCEVIYPVKIIGQEPEEVYYCKAHNGSRKPTDFCSDGRRKDEISKATDS